MKFTKKVTFISEDGFEFRNEPLEGTLSIVELPGNLEVKYEARYLVQDEWYDGDFDERDDSLFHVHYHRDYQVEKKGVITEDDLAEWYRGKRIPQQKDYFIFPLKSLIHSGVHLQLGTGGFVFDPGGWDTSHVGAVLVSKKYWKTKAKAEKAAESLVQEINSVNSGDVYVCCKETFDKDKHPVDYDNCGGCIGFEYAKEELKTF